jgi:hypothetical protein
VGGSAHQNSISFKYYKAIAVYLSNEEVWKEFGRKSKEMIKTIVKFL